MRAAPVGRWTRVRSAPTRRTEVSAARVGRFIYVVGGFTSDGRSSALVERLDIATGRWSPSPAMPRPLNHMNTASYGGKLYVAGGYGAPTDTSSGATSQLWSFDPQRGSWSRLADAPVERAAAGAAVIGHRLYVVGGRNDHSATLGSTSIYDFTTGRWSLGPTLNHPKEHLAAVAARGALYVLGGRALGQGNFADVERWVPGRGGWRRLAPMPLPRAGFQAVVAGARIVVIGGEGASGTIDRVDRFDPVTQRWSRFAQLPTARHGLGVVADGPIIWAIAGGPQPGLTTTSVVERFHVG
ncbi:MAG: hypothetical protein H7287_13410 [Thermoleophilia bacterium]|nr:hypothetical protein [Thermoleophilia bacterium]